MHAWPLVAALAVLAAPAFADEAAPSQTCPVSGLVRVAGHPVRLTPLNRLPPGAVTLTVIRMIGGCGVSEVKAGGVIYYVPYGGQWASARANTVPRQR